MSCLLLFPVDLVITRYLEILSNVPRILCAYYLAVLYHMNTLQINPRIYRVSAHPPVVHELHKSLRNTTRYSEILSNLLLWNFLFAFIMANYICTVIFVDIPSHCHLESNDSICLRMLAILSRILEFILPSWTSFWTRAASRPIKLSLIVPHVYSTYPSLIRAFASDPLIWKS